jgi:hypothetical protein
MAAAHWAGRFALDYLTADWDVDDDDGADPSWLGSSTPNSSSKSDDDPLRGSSWSPFDQQPPERSRARSKPASAGDYVRYSSDSSTSDDEEYITNDDWLMVDEWGAIWHHVDDDSDNGEDDV